jgi:hypothetical protein
MKGGLFLLHVRVIFSYFTNNENRENKICVEGNIFPWYGVRIYPERILFGYQGIKKLGNFWDKTGRIFLLFGIVLARFK